jgi:hypothetical protein
METLQSLYPHEDTQKALAITEAFSKEVGTKDNEEIRHLLCRVVIWRQHQKLARVGAQGGSR